MNPRIVVLCPGGAVTGGPEALHQVVHTANSVSSGSAAICYLPDEVEHQVPVAYVKYNTPIVKIKDIPTAAVVIIPELWPYMVRSFSNKCALWWLSVDNFVCGESSIVDEYQYHLTQSAYAEDFVSRVHNKTPLMLTDYIYLSDFPQHNVIRTREVIVNPAKGVDLINDFERKNTDIQIFRLQGMSRSEVINKLSNGCLYIDFGHHPGRDRLPREAAAAGCVVMVRDIGAASYYNDVQIDDMYKFKDVDEIGAVVGEILSNYEKHVYNQINYKDAIFEQELVFKNEVSNFLNMIG